MGELTDPPKDTWITVDPRFKITPTGGTEEITFLSESDLIAETILYEYTDFLRRTAMRLALLPEDEKAALTSLLGDCPHPRDIVANPELATQVFRPDFLKPRTPLADDLNQDGSPG
jgi:hypothetical protein